MKTDEIRRRFLDFFRERDHRVVPPDTLVPQNDPSLLFTGAGMNQFKDEFYGRGDADMQRAATCQKCLRTGDIENVGKTASHHTYFEMLGNFSFGDYFKDDAIPWAWEFMRDEMGIPADKMMVSIYKEDEEAYDIWHEEVGLPDDRIYRFDEDENFWPANVRSEGPDGPCGPCSEIFYDKGEGNGCGRPGCDPSCDCDRYIEIWNLVFLQYDRKEGGKLDPLPLQNNDTGMGLERIGEIVGHPYETDADDAPLMRRIADHARAVFFCTAEEGDEVTIVLNRTPAYGEAGGQLGDRGHIDALGDKRGQFIFHTVRREKGFFIHQGEITDGQLELGDEIVCTVDKKQRKATARNHTATHLLHYALREVLGEHATQSGSSVSDERLRFDFSNPTELSPEELKKVEDIVNDKILDDEPVVSTHMSRSEAQEMDVMALFGEKYDDIGW
ncbi:MAG: alanine--tRNA ligase-related protein [Planctomycetota bacterium]